MNFLPTSDYMNNTFDKKIPVGISACLLGNTNQHALRWRLVCLHPDLH